jgi:hypothetical protein
VGLSKILSKVTTPGGNAANVTTADPSAQGGTTGLTAGGLVYTSAPGFTGADNFNIMILDPVTGIALPGAVSVTVTAPSASGASMNQADLVVNGDGSKTVSFMGIPGRSYAIQRSTDLATWTTISTQAAAADGSISYTDTAPPVGAAFYRTAVAVTP